MLMYVSMARLNSYMITEAYLPLRLEELENYLSNGVVINSVACHLVSVEGSFIRTHECAVLRVRKRKSRFAGAPPSTPHTHSQVVAKTMAKASLR